MLNEPDQNLQTDPEKSAFKEILDYLETTDLDFIQIEKNGRKIVLRRLSGAGSPKKISDAQKESQELEKKEPEQAKTFSIRSPIVGRFFSSMAPDHPPLVVEGGKVSAGQKVSIVEAMKIKKEVFSAYTGTVVRIHVRDGDPVEYGQELFTIEPEKEENV